MPRQQLSKEALEEALAYTAEVMVRLRSSYQVQKNLVAKYKVSTRTARRWMTKVREIRKAQRSEIDHEGARDDMRESLNTVAALALGRTQVIKNDDGSVAMEEIQRPDGSVVKRPAVRANPDLQKALHAFRELIHLDGLAQPVKAKITLDGDVAVMPDLKNAGPGAAKALEDFLKAVTPDGDISKLAGDMFAFSGEEKRPTTTAPAPAAE